MRARSRSVLARSALHEQLGASSDPLAKVARDVGVNPETLRLWVQAALPPFTAVTDDERAELRRLRREVRELRMERDILKKATAFFAKQSE